MNPDPTPSASGDFLPIASYDHALHGEWVEGRWGDAFDLSTTRFNEGTWWVGRDNPSREIEVPTPTHFRPIPTPPNFPDLFRAQHPVATPPASGETAVSTTAIALEIQRYLVSCGLELFQEFREGIERILDQRLAPLENQYAEEAQNAESQRTREFQAALAASRAECEDLKNSYRVENDLRVKAEVECEALRRERDEAKHAYCVLSERADAAFAKLRFYEQSK